MRQQNGQVAEITLRIPTHIAIIMDGNGRWAKARGLPRLAGHRAGTENLRRVIEACADLGVRILTIYAFSTENWRRPPEEVYGLFGLLEQMIDRELDNLDRNGVQIRHLGSLEGVPERLQRKIRMAIERTKGNSRLILCVAFNYGGRQEIVEAVRRIIADGVPPEAVNEELISRYLYTAGLPDPDLIIRTSGEMRLSNFLLWQAAYAEFYVTPVYWPDFDREELLKAIEAYSRRERRFGQISEQLAPPDNLPDPAVLRQRLLVALIAIPLLAALIHQGGWIWAATVALALGLAAWEYTGLIRRIGFSPSLGWVGLMILGFLIDGMFSAASPRLAELTLTLAPPFALVWFWWIRRTEHPLIDWAFTAAGGLYLGWLGRSFVWLRNLPEPYGRGWVVFVLFVTWGADTAAYFVGQRWGRHRLAPRLSPGKTWEGFLGGCIAGLLVGALLGLLIGIGAGPGALLGLLAGSLGTLGDLSISVLKRWAGVKDSGNLFPGHGGVLDRLDSLLWNAMIAYLYAHWIQGF